MRRKDSFNRLKDGSIKAILYAKDGSEMSAKLIHIGFGYSLISGVLVESGLVNKKQDEAER